MLSVCEIVEIEIQGNVFFLTMPFLHCGNNKSRGVVFRKLDNF